MVKVYFKIKTKNFVVIFECFDFGKVQYSRTISHFRTIQNWAVMIELMMVVATRVCDYFQAHQAILATSAELRKEADDLKHSTGLLKRREHDLARANEELTKSLTEHEARFREEIRLLEEDRDNSRSWKRTLYDRLRPSSAAALPDDVQDLNILVEHQKKENELLTKQLQMAKEDGFSTAAKLRAAQLTISRLQEDLHSSLQGECVGARFFILPDSASCFLLSY